MAAKEVLWNGVGSSLLDMPFCEVVLNEITTFASPEGAETDSKSLQRPVALVRNQFATIVISRIDFWVA